MIEPTVAEFAAEYINENLTFEQLLRVPGVMRLVTQAYGPVILEAYQIAHPLSPVGV